MAWAAPGLRAAMHTVNISGFSFSPSSITINVGDTVAWPNLFGSHSVTGSGAAEAFCGSSFPQSCTVTFNVAGMFPYHCIPHRSFGMTGVVNVQGAPDTPPDVTITSPASDASFFAPASVGIVATATDAGGSVSSVAFYTNGVALLTDNAAPYEATANLGAGVHTLTAIATDNTGLMSTSAPVNIQVVSQPASPIHLDFTGEGSGVNSNGQFSFTFNTDAGFEYVVEGSENLTNWTALATNPGSGAPLRYTESATGLSHRFYRVLLRH